MPGSSLIHVKLAKFSTVVLEDLHNESDVEQKVLWPLLTTSLPRGLGYDQSELQTKANITRLAIGKRENKRLYFPDYIALLSGLPVLVVEAKPPNIADLGEALDEARMYAAKLNEIFETGINPCQRVLASNGRRVLSTAADSTTVDVDLPLERLNPSDQGFATLCDILGRPTLQRSTNSVLQRITNRPLERAISLLGGQSVRNEEIGHNTFGSNLALDFRHIFSPSTPQDRAFLVRNAYVRSNRRDRYVEPIDRLIREIVPPGVAHIKNIEDSIVPTEILVHRV